MRTTSQPQETAPQTAEERHSQLARIADKILTRIQYGACTQSERTQLLREYDLIDRILQRHNAGGSEPDFSLLDQVFSGMREEHQRQE